jgi:predicted lysophospholipase L1 biosynthesis ABC-type transport system permease subunit
MDGDEPEPLFPRSVEKIAMFIILALVILVASFNIISSLVMTVMEKKKDIAILKAMGAKRPQHHEDLHGGRIDHRHFRSA